MKKRREARLRVHELPSRWEDLISADPFLGRHEHEHMKSKVLPGLPFRITRSGFYVHPPSRMAWVVVGGVAYAEDFEQEQYEFKSCRYETIGWDNYQKLRLVWASMRKGSDRDTLREILVKEENYWQLKDIRRGIRKSFLRRRNNGKATGQQ